MMYTISIIFYKVNSKLFICVASSKVSAKNYFLSNFFFSQLAVGIKWDFMILIVSVIMVERIMFCLRLPWWLRW